MIHFYSNNMTNLHHLTTQSMTVLPQKMAIVLRPQICNVISPYPYVSKTVNIADLTATADISNIHKNHT